ncbi:ABC transporter permease [Amycolatopsis suaedae]|uniref:Sugar ABC transporter permease n=1 Tax=Amycolatopsis suaedae TaxID=2510978 RepID=A0A4Q7J4B7_9PSEU|nr:sugar ABC transporter permease [Amycolatopsis suaedae]RZQ61502.1 sugar ABC transporter permease [Amycolatopsis suaedae]
MTTGTLAGAESRRRSWRAALAERGVDTVLLLLIPAVAVIAMLFLYPYVYGLMISLQPLEGGSAFANYESFFSDPYLRETIWYTLRLALPAAVVSVAFAFPLAYRMRRAFRGRTLIIGLFVLPMTFGSVLLAAGMTQIFAPNGWINLSLDAIGLPRGSFLYNYTGTFIALLLSTVPFSFLLLVGMFAAVDRRIEDAAATLGAGPAARFWHVLFPLMVPGLMTALTLAIVEAFAVFPSAVLIGQPDNATHVMSIPLYQAAQQRFDYGNASAIAVVMTVVELVVLGVLFGIRSRLYAGPSASGKG